MSNSMQWSYWEIKTWLQKIDFAVIGSGIVGLTCALKLREQHPKAKIVVFEKGILPQGASTKNAGFACFGSVSEILDDLDNHSEEEVVKLIQNRILGLQQLRTLLGDTAIEYQQNGGFEIFLEKESASFDLCVENMDYINSLLSHTIAGKTFGLQTDTFGFSGIKNTLICNSHEGQIDTGKMMLALLRLVHQKNILLLNSASLKSFEETNSKVILDFEGFQTSCSKLFIATNAFAKSLVNEEVYPKRAQVLISKPLAGLKIKGTFHMDKGYYYFRNSDDRILLGGGRNLDFISEETDQFDLNNKIQDKLERLLKEVILPNQQVEIEHRWTGILGMGAKKTTLLKPISDRVLCGVRLGGMGVAIGCRVGYQLAGLAEK